MKKGGLVVGIVAAAIVLGIVAFSCFVHETSLCFVLINNIPIKMNS